MKTFDFTIIGTPGLEFGAWTLLQDGVPCATFYGADAENNAADAAEALSAIEHDDQDESGVLDIRFVVDGTAEDGTTHTGLDRAPFYVFDIDEQENIAGPFPRRDEALAMAIRLNAKQVG